MIRFYSNTLSVPSNFNMCRTSAVQSNIKVLYGIENGIHGTRLTLQQLITQFQQSLDSSPNGIIVDEQIDILKSNADYSALVVQALNSLNNPSNKIIAVWHSARISNKFAKIYKESKINYVCLESYWPWKSNLMLWIFFKLNYLRAKKNGLLDKYIPVPGCDFGNSFNLNDPWQIIPWANDKKTLDKQISYLSNKCKGISGVGFYVLNDISQNFFKTVDDTIFKYFPN